MISKADVLAAFSIGMFSALFFGASSIFELFLAGVLSLPASIPLVLVIKVIYTMIITLFRWW